MNVNQRNDYERPPGVGSLVQAIMKFTLQHPQLSLPRDNAHQVLFACRRQL